MLEKLFLFYMGIVVIAVLWLHRCLPGRCQEHTLFQGHVYDKKGGSGRGCFLPEEKGRNGGPVGNDSRQEGKGTAGTTGQLNIHSTQQGETEHEHNRQRISCKIKYCLRFLSYGHN